MGRGKARPLLGASGLSLKPRLAGLMAQPRSQPAGNDLWRPGWGRLLHGTRVLCRIEPPTTDAHHRHEGA